MDLWAAAEKGNLERVDYLLTKKKQPVLVNGRDEQRRTPLHLAAQNGHLDVCKYVRHCVKVLITREGCF